MPTNQKPEKDDDALFAEYARSGSLAVREQLIIRYIGLVSYLARRFHAGEEQLDDLIQVGFIGLIKAIDRYDPARGASFTSYAVPTIVGEIQHYFRDLEQAVPMPRRARELRAKAAEEMERLSQLLHRQPSEQEIATALDTSLVDLAAARAETPISLDAHSASAGDSSCLGSALGLTDADLERSEDRAIITQILAGLSLRERIVLYLRFYVGLSQTEVAHRMGVSQMQVSRLQHRSLEKIKRSIEI